MHTSSRATKALAEMAAGLMSIGGRGKFKWCEDGKCCAAQNPTQRIALCNETGSLHNLKFPLLFEGKRDKIRHELRLADGINHRPYFSGGSIMFKGRYCTPSLNTAAQK